METQIRISTGISFNVEVYNDGWSWIATEENYDGPEDRFRIASGSTKEEALESLAENLEEYAEHWKMPNELDHQGYKLYNFTDRNCTSAQCYEDALRFIPSGHKLISITKI